jgi:CheY-like chemotaxis protein
MTIMIVDDSKPVRDIIRSLLLPTADSFCECSDGDEAFEVYARVRPDWVLMDIQMKRMDGFRATREILSSFPDAKIIMVTQYDDPGVCEKAKQAGVREFVLKDNLCDIERIIQCDHS